MVISDQTRLSNNLSAQVSLQICGLFTVGPYVFMPSLVMILVFMLLLVSRSDKLLAIVLMLMLILEVTCYWWQQLVHFPLQRTAVDTNATKVPAVKFGLASPFFY